MSSKVITFLVSAVVITITMGAFVAWMRSQAQIPKRRSKVRPIIAFVFATLVLGASMTMFGRVFGASSPLFAAAVTIATLGWTAFAKDVVAMRLPAHLRKIRSWELRRFPYRTFGVDAFGRFLRNTAVRHLNPAVYLRGAGTQAECVREQLEVAETVHFWASAFTLPYFVFSCIQGWWAAAFAIVIVHVPVNLYPICHLRFARGRVARYLDRKR